MKKLYVLALAIIASIGAANAQRAAEYDLGTRQADYKSYNRIGLSYNNVGYNLNSEAKDDLEIDGFSLNGFGIDYIHGFSLTRSLPMFLELGANVNFNFGTPLSEEEDRYTYKMKMQNINLQVPVNYVYRFNVADSFSIAPYVGLNFKLNLTTRGKESMEYEGEKEEDDWYSFYDKEEMDGEPWNRFQMGWHIGVGFRYSNLYLGLQYGTDFIPAWKYDEDDWHAKINNGNFKLSLGYFF